MARGALTPLGPARWRAEVTERWWIERGPYGGFLCALFVRALEAAVGDPARMPRSLTVHFLAAPAAGPVEIGATVERAGRSVVFVSLRMEQDGGPVALALASAAPWREGEEEWQEVAMPDVAPPEECPPVGVRLPPFTENFEIRWAGGEAGHARNLTWVRAREAPALDHATVASLADTMIPAAFTRMERLAVVPTFDLTIHFRAPLPPRDGGDGWALAVFHSARSAGGAWDEDGEVWSRDGVLLAQSRQLAMMRG